MLKSIVIVGGGSAGWITAGILASTYASKNNHPIDITLVESDNIGTIGVGEGTWPTMVGTLKKIGISEAEFLKCCDASYKQASKFRQWVTGEESDHYYHPFSLPQNFNNVNIAAYWLAQEQKEPFAHAVGLQATLCDQYLAPKQISSPEYASVENHGYHLDAGKFTKLLTKHCTTKLNVNHIVDDVIDVKTNDSNDIVAISTKTHGDINGDLFIDCSGLSGLLIDKHYKVPLINKKDVLFIDKALAVQIPYLDQNSPIESVTISTAQKAGWIWDIGLPTRRGVGHVYSSKYMSKNEACEQLKEYLRHSVTDVEKLKFRELEITPGYREKFWVNNCVAVGMSAGFLEPLEASALIMIELAANVITQHLPASRKAMDTVAKNYNKIFTFRWERIVDFLKLHYVLSKRTDSQFWIDNRKEETIPESLKDLLTLWQEQPPSDNGFLSPYDLFPAASYQYILYGMGFNTKPSFINSSESDFKLAKESLQEVQKRKNKVPKLLPTNRELLKSIVKLELSSDQHPENNHCVEVDIFSNKALADTYPLFLKKDNKSDLFKCVALLGFEKNEDLISKHLNKPSLTSQNIKSGAFTKSDDKQSLAILQKFDLIEPVKLDITFDNSSNTLISDLYTINNKKLGELSSSVKAEVQQLGLIPIINSLIKSLSNVPTLISLKNNVLRN